MDIDGTLVMANFVADMLGFFYILMILSFIVVGCVGAWCWWDNKRDNYENN